MARSQSPDGDGGLSRLEAAIESGIIRVENEERASMPRATVRDKNLTWEARGMLSYLLSHFDGWETRFNDLVNQSPRGRTVVRRIIRELINHGYMERSKQRNSRGHFDWVTSVRERPKKGKNPNKSTRGGFPPVDERPVVERPAEDPPAGNRPIKGSSKLKDQVRGTKGLFDESYPPAPSGEAVERARARATPSKEPKAHEHPAIQAVHTVLGKYHSKLLWPRTIEVLGENPDINFLMECAIEAAARNLLPVYAKWLFAWYPEKRIPPLDEPRRQPAKTPAPIKTARTDAIGAVDRLITQAETAAAKGTEDGH